MGDCIHTAKVSNRPRGGLLQRQNIRRADKNMDHSNILSGPEAAKRLNNQSQRYGRVVKSTGMKVE